MFCLFHQALSHLELRIEGERRCGDEGNGGSGDNKPKGYVSASELGKNWPLTVDEGTLDCEPVGDSAGAVTFEADDVYNQADADGFIHLQSLRLRTFAEKRMGEGE